MLIMVEHNISSSIFPLRPATASGALGVSGARHTRTPETAPSPKPGSARSKTGSGKVLYVQPSISSSQNHQVLLGSLA